MKQSFGLGVIVFFLLAGCQQNIESGKSPDSEAKAKNISTEGISGVCSNNFISDYNDLFQSCSSMKTVESAENCKLSIDAFQKINPTFDCNAKTSDDQLISVKDSEISKFTEKLTQVLKD